MIELPRWKRVDRLGSKGQSTIELAVFLPLFLFVLLGMIEMGNAYDIVNRASQAAYHGARYAAEMRGGDLSNAENLARQFVGDSANITVSQAGSGAAPCGTLVTVTVHIDSPLLTGKFLKLFAAFESGTLAIERSSTALYVQL